MRIDFLTLKNFRCFEEREFRFHPQMNVLIGENGIGKTAILEALATAAGSWLLGIGDFGSRPIRQSDAGLVGKNLGDETTFEARYPVMVAAEGWAGDQHVTWQRTLASSRSRTTYGDVQEIRKIAVESDTAVRAGEPITLPVIAYYGAGRLWLQPRDSSSKRTSGTKRDLSRLEGYRDSIDNRVSHLDLQRWMMRQDMIAYQEGREPALLRAVREAMRQMVGNAADVRFNPRRLEIVVEWENGLVHPFSNLSDGQRNMIALAGDLAMRMARLNPQFGLSVLTETPGIVLIDELDLHLHPNWQRRVVGDFRRIFPKVQFITTTHSPFIVQTLHEGELINLQGQTVPEVENLGVETISRGLMGVPHPEVSPHYREMVDNAKSYLELLDEAKIAPEEKLEEFKERLADQIEPYADNPAYQAFLEMKRAAKLGD